MRNINKDTMKKLEEFYEDNLWIDAEWYNHCFYEGNYDHWDSKKIYSNEVCFWEYVEEKMRTS